MAKVLIAEDNEFFRDMLNETLTSEGHSVISANDGEQALALLGKEKVDLLITDIIMPKVTGVSLIKQVAKLFPDVKIIAISGGWRGGMSDYLKTTQEEGASYAFTKPLDMEELMDAVDDLLEK